MKKTSKVIVIDTDIARAAGGEGASHPVPKNCRDFLLTFLNSQHYIASSPMLKEEWQKHASNFTRKWLATMVAKRRFKYIVYEPTTALEQRIISNLATESIAKAVSKDFHLLEAALSSDKIIVSKDENMRHILCNCSQFVSELRDIVWVNPTNESETPQTWLENGAPADKDRLLGSQQTNKRSRTIKFNNRDRQ